MLAFRSAAVAMPAHPRHSAWIARYPCSSTATLDSRFMASEYGPLLAICEMHVASSLLAAPRASLWCRLDGLGEDLVEEVAHGGLELVELLDLRRVARLLEDHQARVRDQRGDRAR